MAILVFGVTYLIAAAVYYVVVWRSSDERGRMLKDVSPGLLSPLGSIFALLVAFLAAQVWSDVANAHSSVNREASALRAVVLLARAFPGENENRIRGAIARHIRDARDSEWPAMAHADATLTMVPAPLAQTLELAVALPATTPGELAAQREIISQLDNASDARRQRILLSAAGLDWVKWSVLLAQALCTLIAIAAVHGDKRGTARVALGLFATAAAVCILLIAAHDRPFTGQLAVLPTPLLQVLPDTVPGAP
jgi:hypothetical protein